MKHENETEVGYLRLPQVLQIIPVSKSTWFRGIQKGKYPQPVKIGIRASGWKIADVRKCIDVLNANKDGQESTVK